MTTLIVWRLMEAPLGTSRFARLLESYRLATKQPPPPGLVLVHNQLSAPTLAHEKSFRRNQPSRGRRRRRSNCAIECVPVSSAGARRGVPFHMNGNR
jgi:hypothetical protein